jgi:hypothetical protein
VQLEVRVKVQQRCFQRQSISRGRAIRRLPSVAGMTGRKRRRTHIAAPRAEHARDSKGLPRRGDAISKAGVRRPDTGRVIRHEPRPGAGPPGSWLACSRGGMGASGSKRRWIRREARLLETVPLWRAYRRFL